MWETVTFGISKMIIPPVTALPQVQTPTSAQNVAQQAPQPVVAVAAPTAVQTRQATVASGNSGGSAGARGDKGKKTDNNASATETRTDTAAARPRGMGRKADLSV
jgi:hypothetical protein